MKLITKSHTYFFRSHMLTRQACLMMAAVYIIYLFVSCNNDKTPAQQLVSTPEKMDEKLPGVIKKMIGNIEGNSKLEDSILIFHPTVIQYLYSKTDYAANWSKMEEWTITADSLVSFIENAKLFGLFPEDYHLNNILSIRQKIAADSLAAKDRKDAVLWSRADVLLTDALVQIINHVKMGRLQKDSITLRVDSVLSNEFYEQQVQKIIQSLSVTRIIQSLEPVIKGYHELKAGIKKFLDSAEFKEYTYVPYPVYDSAKFKKALQQRLLEEDLLVPDSLTDTSQWVKAALKQYQEKNKLKVDGKAGGETIRSLNATDKDKFIRIAISLDKYKMLPAAMPSTFVWVNLPSYFLQLWENDSVKIVSRVVVGKPLTRTPVLNSSISEMITYPQWTIPQSIIVKEILPALKKNPGYLEKKGFSLLDSKNEEVDPYFVDWSRFKTGIPYKVVQGSGDANALGVLKFNFPNKYAVYLHDTNQRYLFGQQSRALSHGCVRVQEWYKLTKYILRNDSLQAKLNGKGTFTKLDSVSKWLSLKEKRYVQVRNKIPLFIRYITCEGKDGKIVFYDDIYNEDRWLRERYFAGK